MAEFAEHLQNALGSNYQLDRELTGGGMSRVFVATDRVLGRKVVVKVLPPELAAGVNRDRFRREIQVVAQLQHPHIVPLLSAGEQDDLLWYTMPFIEGESLRAAIERKRQFSAREVMRILHDIVDALAFAHARGVIHRDIKPANVLMQGSHALVTDFGVAKALSAAMPIGGVTSAGIAIGTPAYMAPEQLAGDSSADHRMDIYAVGLLAYELVTGVSPFTGPSPRETLAAQLTRVPQPLHEISAGLPRSLSDLIMRCLAKDPSARPQTADEILQELDAMTMPLGVTPQAGGVEARKPRRPWMSIAAVAILFAVLAGVGYAVTRAPTTPQPSATATKTVPSATPPHADSTARAATPPALPVAAPPAPPPRPVISHDDSVRIAAAVAKRVAAARTADSVAKAKLAAETQRKMIDSIIAANSGNTAGGAVTARRIAVAEPAEVRGWPQAPILGQAVSDSLRRMLRSRPKQFTLVDQDSVRTELLRTRDVSEVARAVNSDLLISIRLTPTRNDSAMMMMQVYDLTAAPPYRSRMAVGRPLPKNEVLASLDQVLLSTMTLLDEMTRAPRRASPSSPTPPTPTPPNGIPRP
jgi:eukaryotic-like serine/threonine-protein kinase